MSAPAAPGPGIGHNSGDEAKVGGIAADRLRNLVNRIEGVEEEQKIQAEMKRDIYTEAKSAGFDVKVLRQIITLRKQDPADLALREGLRDVYLRALGS